MKNPTYSVENVPNSEVDFIAQMSRLDDGFERLEIVNNGDGTSNILVWVKPLSNGATSTQPAVQPPQIPTINAGIPLKGIQSTPTNKGVPFAAYNGDLKNCFWPVITVHGDALLISHVNSDGEQIGRSSRSFMAKRSGGKRYHVGIDIFCEEYDEVVSITPGTIRGFHKFYKTNSGELSFALLVEHNGIVVNYGEVKQDAPKRYNWSVGSSIAAGQKIAQVSSTNMIHLETYVKGTSNTYRWMKSDKTPPQALLDPSKFLVDLSVAGKRLTKGGQPSQAPTAYDGPIPESSNWRSKFNGRKWRYDHRGVYTKDVSETNPWRTQGPPLTCRHIFDLYGLFILEAAERHGVNPALIMMTIATETAFAKDENFTGPKTFRWESHVSNDDVSPSFKGTYSAGPMQSLATTAREMLKKHGKKYGLIQYDPLTVAPALKPKPNPIPTAHPLYDAKTAIELGAGEIRMRLSKTKDDPILVAAAYNTGGIYPSQYSKWGIRAHNDHLDRAAQWYSDGCAVLSERGVF